LNRGCDAVQIRAAYRLLAKRSHPDVNRHDAEARSRTQTLNAAYEVLSDPKLRRAYDRELSEASRAAAPGNRTRIQRNISQDVRIGIDDFLRGGSIEVKVNDPANGTGPETYQLHIPAGTSPGARLRIPRTPPFDDGHLQLRLKALPGSRFKVRGYDLRCDLRISPKRAENGGVETITGPTGIMLRLSIPARVSRGELLRINNEGMPKPRGGRGDLIVRITYRPEVRISRAR